MKPTEVQESLYSFPYHYLPTEDLTSAWRIARYLHWGYEYLAILETVKTVTLRTQPRRVLDFGCGDGRLSKELINSGIQELIGIDTSERALLFSKAFICGDSNIYLHQRIQEVDRSLIPVDAIIAMEVLEHIEPSQLDNLIKQFHEIIDRNGTLIVSVPTKHIPINRKHYQHFSEDILINRMKSMFIMKDCQFIHKVGVFSELVRRMIVNRLFIVNSEAWLKLTTKLYKKFIMKADSKTGAHMICTFLPC
jgi:2-polyprenyl-3-methyl-5-hydroxy-6-metoxy-1,4-benzoquinol methylase